MDYQYSYETAKNYHHHDYLFSPLLSLINGIKITNKVQDSPLRILDLGCGNGSLTSKLAKQGYEMWGLEESESGIIIARQNFPKCQFIQGSIYNIPYDQLEGKFDIVVAIDVIEHLLYPKELPKAAKECLKPNGRLIITTPYHGYLKNLALSITDKWDQHLTVLWDGGHIKFFSVKTLSKLLMSEGYHDIKFAFAGRIPYLWKDMLCSCSPN